MDEGYHKLSRTLWVGIALLVAIVFASFLLSRMESPRRSSKQGLGRVADFTLTNQLGATVTLTDLRGHVWVADIIFTTCAGPCPRMTQQMKALQDALPASSQARLVSLTTDPDTDTPAVLKAYGERFGAKPERWMFLTGTKKEIGNLALGGLKLAAVEKKPEERENPQDLFVHSTLFVVVDKQGQLREVFQSMGEGVDPALVRGQILALVAKLERER